MKFIPLDFYFRWADFLAHFQMNELFRAPATDFDVSVLKKKNGGSLKTNLSMSEKTPPILSLNQATRTVK